MGRDELCSGRRAKFGKVKGGKRGRQKRTGNIFEGEKGEEKRKKKTFL